MNQSQLLIRCPSCNKIPLVTLIELPTLQIDIHCSCSFHQTYPIQIYLSNIENETTQTPQIKSYSKCSEHLNGVIQYYCLTCKKHFCYIDFHLHEHCKYIDLKKFYSDEKVDSILENFSIAKKEIMTYNDTIKNQIVQSLKEKAASIEECFQKKIEKIHEMFGFITIMINNYMSIPTNYYVLSNLMNHSHFKVEKCLYKKDDTSLKNIQIITKYFNTAQILDYVPDSVNSYFFKQKNKVIPNGIKQDKRNSSDSQKYNIRTIAQNEPIINGELFENNTKLLTYIGTNGFILHSLDDNQTILINKNKVTGNIVNILSNGEIISANDNFLYIWGINGNSLILKGTIKSVLNQKIYYAKLISTNVLALCTYGKNIKFISLNSPFNSVFSTINLSSEVVCFDILLDKEVLLCCYNNSNLDFFDLATSIRIKTLRNIECTSEKSFLQINDRLFVGGSNILTVIDSDTYNILKKIENKSFKGISSICSYNNTLNIILLGCVNGNLIQFDVKNEKVIANINAYNTQIKGLFLLPQKKVLSYSAEPSIKIWDFQK